MSSPAQPLIGPPGRKLVKAFKIPPHIWTPSASTQQDSSPVGHVAEGRTSVTNLQCSWRVSGAWPGAGPAGWGRGLDRAGRIDRASD